MRPNRSVSKTTTISFSPKPPSRWTQPNLQCLPNDLSSMSVMAKQALTGCIAFREFGEAGLVAVLLAIAVVQAVFQPGPCGIAIAFFGLNGRLERTCIVLSMSDRFRRRSELAGLWRFGTLTVCHRRGQGHTDSEGNGQNAEKIHLEWGVFRVVWFLVCLLLGIASSAFYLLSTLDG